jgi:hypothetical protein
VAVKARRAPACALSRTEPRAGPALEGPRAPLTIVFHRRVNGSFSRKRP